MKTRAWCASICFLAAAAICRAQTYTITTAAGGANPYYFSGTGDGGSPTSAGLGNPAYDVAVDSAGNLYIAAGGLIRKVSNGKISTLAGGGTSLDDGVSALKAALAPTAMILDSAGDILIADAAYGTYRVRKVTAAGIITTIAGGGPCCKLGDGGPAASAYLEVPYGLALDGSGNLYIAQAGPSFNLVRKVSANGTITTLAGGGAANPGDGGPATSAALLRPTGVAVAGGNVYIADTGANRVRVVSDGTINTLAGTGAANISGDGGPANQAGVDRPWHVAADSSGSVFISEFYDARVRMVTSGGTINTAAGSGQVDMPAGIAVSSAGIYVADDNPTAPRVQLLTSAQPTVSITLASSPSGLNASLDGNACTTPCVLNLNAGSMHTIAASSPQSPAAGTQYVFSSWSDGGAISHSITVPSAATTYTASFQTQYQLTTSASPTAGGGVTPASGGYYTAGTSVAVTATANAGYMFGGWSGDLSGTENPQSITMNAAHSVTANFVTSVGGCTIGLSATTANVPATGTSTAETCPNNSGQPNCGVAPEVPVTFPVTPGASCGPWTATSSNPEFLQITSGASGSGPGTVGFTVLNNTHNGAQNYSITVASGAASASYKVTEAGSGDSEVYRQINALYEQLLGRDPDSGGFGFWTGVGGAGLGQMADSFLTSPEAFNSDFAVMAAYQAATGAPPTFAQYNAAASSVHAGAQSIPGLFSSLVGGSFTMGNLYQNLLNRAPGPSDSSCTSMTLADCFQAIIGYPSSVTPVGAANSEFQSTGSFHADHTNGLYAQMIYYVTLSRDPDPSGLAFWTGVANTGGPGVLFQGSAGYPTRIQILGPGTPNQGFIGSPEFQSLFAN